MNSKPLLLCAQPYGYGPVSKLLCLAEGLQAKGVPTVFIGTGITLELARRSSSLFQDIINASASSSLARTWVGNSIAVLSVMDREYSALATELQRPLYIVDSLYWMRSSLPGAFRGAHLHWAQDFDGVRDQLTSSQDAVRVVGPILSPKSPTWRKGGGLVVNLGGASSTFASVEENAAYWRFTMQGILQSALADKYEHRILVIAGKDCLGFLGAEFGGSGFRLESLSHETAIEAFASAGLVLTSPGLTTSLECFQIGVPAFFLPPQNYSQWCNLKSFRSRGFARHSFHWEDMGEQYTLANRLEESKRDPLIRRAIDSLSLDSKAQLTYVKGLSGVAACDLPGVLEKQSEYFRSLEPNGTMQIIEELLSSLQPDV